MSDHKTNAPRPDPCEAGERPENARSGIAHIAAAFAAARQENRAALMPYFALGYPDYDTSLEIVKAIAAAGADLIELGLPFSDPLADGPTIQHATHVALENGMTQTRCLELTAALRADSVTQPLMLMGYYNPILAYGPERFVDDAAAAGADGFIVPDLPPEEADALEALCRERGLALVYLLAPTSTPARVEIVAAATSGFLYLVSLAGVTGARDALPADLDAFVARTREMATCPLAVGFGISTTAQARAVGQIADGVIVGSALINAVREANDPAEAAAAFVCALHNGLSAAAE